MVVEQRLKYKTLGCIHCVFAGKKKETVQAPIKGLHLPIDFNTMRA